MRYNTVKDLIDWAIGFHERMAHQYRDAAATAKSRDERLAMALDYLSDRELKLKSGLETLTHDGFDHREVLDTWFDETGEFPEPPALDALAERPVADSIDALMRTAADEHERLESLYRHRAEQAGIEPEEEFFTALADGHNAEGKRMVMSLKELQSM
ncbi:2-hydroxyacyl-CoA dehydratase [Halomonas dongshanensis]|uniref:2-hydroxyacyl-CoA dehydratase n=1 Tax=Halomonas dongshanensis TaxID=2890835 RepID=A0ABT2ECW4_9GAMM|nr:2-hydroxyacyl-CoA dehydratase [Halomonas dongshanensis]MCS2609416.1 2-hydroxyacyl-CoA dehydratase [Halomonas dongshanensis]